MILHAEIYDMTALAFSRFSVSCAAQPRRAGRTAAAKPQVGRVSASGNGASIADLAHSNGASNGATHSVRTESLTESSAKGNGPEFLHVKL